MSDFKTKLQQTVIAPAASQKERASLVGEVTSIDEANNYCAVRFTDKNGSLVAKTGIPVKLYNSAIVDWFPKVGELVNLEENSGHYEVTSTYEYNYGSNVRGSLELKNDILPQTINNNTGGYIF